MVLGAISEKKQREKLGPKTKLALIPTSDEEMALFGGGYRYIAGIDEAGRGCLAGPVVAAAVILPYEVHIDHGVLHGVRDSKILTPAVRAELQTEIQARAITFGVGVVGADRIDDIGIVPATRMAMAEAVANLSIPPEYLLIDYLSLKEISIPQKGITYGDSLCFSIAAASIIAKVTRDRLMDEFEITHGGFGFCRNKGYGTPEHLAALSQLGPCAIHRRTFGPVQILLDDDTPAD